MADKSKIRSIRFTEELYELIDRQAGDTFTQKLENLVTKCIWELPAKEKQLKDIQEQIDRERKQLRRIQDAKYKTESNIRDINYTLENAKRQIDRIAKALEGIEV